MNFPAFFRHIWDSEEFFLILHAQASCCFAKGDLLTFWTGVDLWMWEPEQTWDPHDRAMYSVGGRAEVKSPSTYFFSVPKKKKPRLSILKASIVFNLCYNRWTNWWLVQKLVSKLDCRQVVFVTYYFTMNTDDYALMIKLSGVEFHISWCYRLRSLTMGVGGEWKWKEINYINLNILFYLIVLYNYFCANITIFLFLKILSISWNLEWWLFNIVLFAPGLLEVMGSFIIL